jgi:hypothetical protein
MLNTVTNYDLRSRLISWDLFIIIFWGFIGRINRGPPFFLLFFLIIRKGTGEILMIPNLEAPNKPFCAGQL